MSELMGNEVYNAAVKGDVTIFENPSQQYNLFKKTNQRNNILHIAAKHEQNEFIVAVLSSFPKLTCESLIYEENSEGNTPLHIAAEVGDEAIVVRLCDYFLEEFVDVEGGQQQEGRLLPWRVVNSEGNSPAHLALLYGNVLVARYLVEKDGYISTIINHSKQALLHLAIQYHVDGTYESQIYPVLLKTESIVACREDGEGFTPLHRAASLEPSYCLPVVKAILVCCPQSVELHNALSGNSILHLLMNHQVPSYEEGVELLNIPEVYALRNRKNLQGDTPLHIAARNKDINMVQVLLGSSAKPNIRNNDGVTAGYLVRKLGVTLPNQMGNGDMLVERKRKLTKEECAAAENRNVSVLQGKIDSIGIDFLLSQPPLPKGGNIFHILMDCEFNRDTKNEAEEFIGKAIMKFPLLITQKDCNGNTPVHVLAKYENSERLLDLCYKHFKEAREEAGDAAIGTLYCWPWRLRNIEGDTPLHVAARAGCIRVSRKLVKFDEGVAGYVNNRNQTPLHMLCICEGSHLWIVKNSWSYSNDSNGGTEEDILSCLTKANAKVPYMRDDDGLTPLLIAARDRNIFIIEKLIVKFPECLKMADLKGRTLLHMFVYQLLRGTDLFDEQLRADKKVIKSLKDVDYAINSQITNMDNDGNTPLHLAIKNQHFDFAQFFIRYGQSDEPVLADRSLAILKIENNDGVSSLDLIGSAEHIPRQFEKYLWRQGKLLSGHRSMYGVPTTKIYDYANTIGVVAALLTTITFTAAFTVPGGLDTSNGTPLLLQEAAFQVFIVSDVAAMCSSVMVLFCLLWIMTTGNKKESILLLDVSVFLLQTSLYATLLTFMTGLYITTVAVAPGIAIFTCVICSLLILLMHKGLVMATVVPFCGILIVLSRALGDVIKFCFAKVIEVVSIIMFYLTLLVLYPFLRLCCDFRVGLCGDAL